ncbi:glycosyltransferase family 39 protein, partial [Patescibacteria group bacterium]|nr:glycosyltransferase family 39 protein [Patescibacteria group bacterium]
KIFFLYATCVFPIQSAHAYTVDPLLNTCLFFTLYSFWQLYRSPRPQKALVAGLSFGIVLAIKITGIVLIIPLLGCLLTRAWLDLPKKKGQLIQSPRKKIFFALFQRLNDKKVKRVLWHQLKLGTIIAVSAVGIFFVCQPYAFLDWTEFLRQLTLQGQMTKNPYVFPYTLQYVDTPAYLYPLKNIVQWGMGPALGTVSLGGLFYLLFNFKSSYRQQHNLHQKSGLLIFLAFFLTYFLLVGQFAVKFMRYLLPLYPLLTLFAGNLIVKTCSKKGVFSLSLKISLLGLHLLWTTAFLNVYRQPQTKIQASQWIHQNVPVGSTIAIEHWDDRLPLFNQEKYRFLELPLYDQDSHPSKWPTINNYLDRADYLIIASHRLYTPLQKLASCQTNKACYPITANYYQQLFQNQLDFRLVANFQVRPGFKIGPWQIIFDDQKADESFTVFDHPFVFIFQKKKV